MPSELLIGNKMIGEGHPTFIITEIGINHNGDLAVARRLIDVAVMAGCDAVKFQKRTPEKAVPPEYQNVMRETPWGIISYLEYRRKVEFFSPALAIQRGPCVAFLSRHRFLSRSPMTPKILLIQPCSDSQRWKGQKSHFGWPPLGLGYVAAATPPGYAVRIVDEAVEAIDFDADADLIGIGIMTPNALRGYAIADEFRKRGRPVMIGGIHASMLPDEARGHADAVVIGEAENTWPQLLRDYAAGRLQGLYQAERHLALWEGPSPRRDLFRQQAYRFPSTVMATRGCPHGCSCCSTSRFFGRKYRKRNPQNVAREIASLHDRLFIFIDDNLCFDREYSLELLRLIAPLKKWWVCQVTLNVAEDDKISEDRMCRLRAGRLRAPSTRCPCGTQRSRGHSCRRK